MFFDNRFVILSKFNGILALNNDHSTIFDDFGNNEILSKSYKYIFTKIFHSVKSYL